MVGKVAADNGIIGKTGQPGTVEPLASRTGMERMVREMVAAGRKSVVPELIATVGGGRQNTADGGSATVGGGDANVLVDAFTSLFKEQPPDLAWLA